MEKKEKGSNLELDFVIFGPTHWPPRVSLRKWKAGRGGVFGEAFLQLGRRLHHGYFIEIHLPWLRLGNEELPENEQRERRDVEFQFWNRRTTAELACFRGFQPASIECFPSFPSS